MSEKRRPELVVRLRSRHGRNLKVEVFNGEEFPRRLFTDVFGNPIKESQTRLYRLRVNGVWSPLRAKVLYTQEELEAQLAELMRIPPREVPST